MVEDSVSFVHLKSAYRYILTHVPASGGLSWCVFTSRRNSTSMGLIADSVIFTQRVTSPTFSETSISVSSSNPTVNPVVVFMMQCNYIVEVFGQRSRGPQSTIQTILKHWVD